MKNLLLLVSLLFFGHGLSAQEAKPAPGQACSPTHPEPAALTQSGDPALDAAISRLYAIISGPAGQKRDWAAFKAMFAPGAQLGVTYTGKDGVPAFKPLSPEEYIATSGKYIEEKGFFEREIGRRTERFGNLVQVWSTYEAREKDTDAKPLMRGINSIQLVRVGNQYLIASLIWQAESPVLQLPSEYLPQK